MTAVEHAPTFAVTVTMAAPVAAMEVRRVLHAVAPLAEFEPKVDRVVVTPDSDVAGSYQARGRMLGVVRWDARFSYSLRDDGFDSASVTDPCGVHVVGWFDLVDRAEGGCDVTHVEQYWLPAWVAWSAPFWRRFVASTMRRELDALAALASSSTAVVEAVSRPGK